MVEILSNHYKRDDFKEKDKVRILARLGMTEDNPDFPHFMKFFVSFYNKRYYLAHTCKVRVGEMTVYQIEEMYKKIATPDEVIERRRENARKAKVAYMKRQREGADYIDGRGRSSSKLKAVKEAQIVESMAYEASPEDMTPELKVWIEENIMNHPLKYISQISELPGAENLPFYEELSDEAKLTRIRELYEESIRSEEDSQERSKRAKANNSIKYLAKYREDQRIRPFRHQQQLIQSVFSLDMISDFFLVGGYGCGKSFSAALLILGLAKKYNDRTPVFFGIGSPTITFFQKTIWPDLERLLVISKSEYSYDQQKNKIMIGTVTFVVIPTEQPQQIFGFNFNGFIVDELDELPQEKAIEAYGAITERSRVQLPPITDEEHENFMLFKQLEDELFAEYEGWKSQGILIDSERARCGAKIVEACNDSQLCKEHKLAEYKRKSGRKPFKVFVTTAQGYRGTYQIIEGLKDRGEDFVLIRGLTKDNTANSREYFEKLWNLYSENERAAFLEGKFVNLTSGRVYPDYDSSVHDTKDTFELLPEDKVLIGQDLNAGFSKSVAIVKRDKCFYVVKTYSFKSISDAPFVFRRDFPENEIYWYPDASAKEIMNAYTKEIAAYNINLRIGSVNPSILERIFIVNKLFKTGRLKLFEGKATNELQLALKTRQYDDSGKPEKGKGEKAPDHICDSFEYVLYRAVSSDADFFDLWKMTKSYKSSEGSE